MIRSSIPEGVALVLDTSLFIAAISPSELHHVSARALYDEVPAADAFLVPSLFRVEVLAALARRGESGELLDLVDTLVTGPRFQLVALEAPLLERAAAIARAARLRAYDAVYAAVAVEQSAALLTLDADVCAKLDATLPGVMLVMPA